MEKIIKIIVKAIFAVIIIYLISFLTVSLIYSYHITIRKNFNSYVWFFNETCIKDIDTICYGGSSRKTDVFFNYIYVTNEKKYQIGIWEFKNPYLKDITYSNIRQNTHFEDAKFWAGETLDKGSNPETTVRFGPFFKNSVNIDLDNLSKIEKLIETPYYKGFYGTVNKLSLNDGNVPKVIIEYDNWKEPCMVLLCKGQKSFYAIIINSEKPFDESIIDIFNLTPSNLR